MRSMRENEQERGNAQGEGDEAPPPYDDASHLQEAAAATDSKHPSNGLQDATEARPTVESPFNFPPAYTPSTSYPNGTTSSLAGPSTSGIEYSDLPEVVNPSPRSGQEYSNLPQAVFPSQSSTTSISPPVFIAIPQIAAKPTSPFPPAYNAAILLRRGISRDAFTSFLSTLSAFLNANVSERALAHALDVGRDINSIPKKFSKDTVAHVKSVGRHVQQSAKEGNIISAGFTALTGTLTIPVAAALRVVDATLHQLPVIVSGGLSKKPLSPHERAVAYLAVAQRDWFGNRGLAASLCNTAELLQRHAQFRGSGSGSGNDNEIAVKNLVNLVHRTWERGAEGQLQALQSEFGFAPLEITDGQPSNIQNLDIGAGTLWLVLTEAPSEAPGLSGKGSY
ncbi:hypothetical protein E0Z10_g3709 [Xylaria hypoxylon]|uniref:Uncharacterized protein n=1 Tax=Xylaria hypoxylon TaxID=37992 RepID=A0A4Z0Z6U1_9PEZI|nr:hypothetical protein E0Z10_g3709 [Xylaria hypoxylon]